MALPFIFLFFLFLFLLIFRFVYTNLWIPWRLQSHFNKLRLTGPRYRLFTGNSSEVTRLTTEAKSKPIPSGDNPHDFVHRVAPHYHKWSRAYGKTFLYWFGTKPVVATSDPKLIREALKSKSFDRIGHNPLSKLLYAQGLPGLRGDQWAFHRRIAVQAFTMDKVKRWVPQMVASTKMFIEKWEEMRNGEEEIELDVHREVHSLSAHMLSRTAFGNNVEEGKRIFALQERMMRLFYLVRWSIYIPGYRFLPSKTNREIWRIEKQIRGSILGLIEKNKTKDAEIAGTLLQAFMSPYVNQNGQEERLGIEEVIDECKTFYFAAKETTGDLMTWVLVLLAMHQEWQSIAREEVNRVLGPTGLPTPDILQDLKILGMIINETLRLYPPAMTLNRDTRKKAKLGSLEIPKGTQLYLSVVAMHHDRDAWGEDAEEFNPGRFEDTRKESALLVPFGLGVRTCVGQNLAVVEAKTVLATILRHYSFRLSPSYVHAPVLFVTLQPQKGAHLLFSRI
ncbi:unnamed protein product [Brassica rapa subsp. narinosa]